MLRITVNYKPCACTPHKALAMHLCISVFMDYMQIPISFRHLKHAIADIAMHIHLVYRKRQK